MDKLVKCFTEPDEDYLKIAKPTADLLQTIMASIKNCQKENTECEDLIKLSHSVLNTFITTPLVK